MPTIYLVSANPFRDKPLHVDVEQRSILRRLPRYWDIKLAPAARISDLVSDLRRFGPDVVHFSSHGSPMERLVLLDDQKEAKEVSRATMQSLFDVMKGEIRLVVLNACYSRTQAEIIAATIDCVVGVSGTLGDVNAIQYSEQFYEALAAGRSVKRAHEEASIILTDIPKDHKPDLIEKSGVDARTVVIAPASYHWPLQQYPGPPSSPHISNKKTAFEESIAHYGVSAERLSNLKIGNPDGSFISKYEIEDLRGLHSDIASVSWQFMSTSGLVMAPILEDSAIETGVRWATDPDPQPSCFEDVLKNLGTLRGKFVFDPPIRRNTSRSFSWTMQVLNGDALTAWEFNNLYSGQKPLHVDGKSVAGKPSEFYAQLVWFPVRELRVGLRLPPSQTSRPQLRYFELKKKPPEGIPLEHVFHQGELKMHPGSKIDWTLQNAMWQRNTEMERLEADSIGFHPEVELRVEYPVLGSYYSLDWSMPDPPLPLRIDHLRAETEVVRDALLAHKSPRFHGPATAESGRIRNLFAAVHNEARDFLNATEPSFSTTLMTWDRERYRMEVVEMRRNDGLENEADWRFWLPFGLGLAGMCFRTATGAFRYQHDLDRKDPERPETYVPVPGIKPHAFLLSLPIDHPEMTEEIGHQPNAQRCRQLVGVLSIGSASPASNLLEYCRLTITDKVFDRLRDLRDACQKKIDVISYAMLETAGLQVKALTGQEAPKNAASDTVKTELIAADAGIIHQPRPEWVSPIRANRYRHKVAAFDFDGTLLRGDKFAFSWELVWQHLGFGKGVQNELKRQYRQQVARATTRAQRIEAYKQWCEGAVDKFKSRRLTRDQLRAMLKPLSLTKNCRDALKAIRAEGVVTAIISGGISAVLEDTFADYRDYFDFVFMNELLFSSSGMISSVLATAYDFEGKADALALICNRAGATLEETVYIGDRFNDEAVMIQAKTAIAYLPSDAVAESVSHVRIQVDDLLAVVPHVLVE